VRQRCRDGDAGCDADATVGACTFTVALCFDRDDTRLARDGRSCRRAPIESWTLLKPALGDGEDAAMLLAAVGAVDPSMTAGAVVTFTPALEVGERCTAPVSITVATRGRRAGVRVLRARTAAAGGRPRDVDVLKLVCAP
jgi:hypothetical protein